MRDGAAILHVDLDAFFASVEQLDDPSLRGRPVLVGGLGPRGVVSAASYEARRFGVHSAMPMARARRACPQAVVLPPRFERYEALSRDVMAILGSVSPLVEQLSIDEAFVDVGGAGRLLGSPVDVAHEVRRRVRDETGLTASVGVASTKFLAKLASDLAKPDGLLAVEPGTEEVFLAPLPVSRLWGVGPATLQRLDRMGVRSIGELAALPESALTAALGASLGHHLSDLAHNRDDRAVVPERAAKSIGAEETFAADLRTRDECARALASLADRAASRLRRAELHARTITLKIRFADFSTRTRARTLPEPTDARHLVLATSRELLQQFEVGAGVRLLGVSLSNFDAPPHEQGALRLDDDSDQDRDRDARRAAVDRAIDDVRDRFGTRAVGAAALVHRRDRRGDG